MNVIKNKSRYLVYLVFLLVIFAIYYSLILPNQIDYSFHVYDIFLIPKDQLPFSDFYRFNNLFHYLLYFMYSILHVDLRLSATIILTIILFLRIMFFDYVVYRSTQSKSLLVPLLIVGLVFFMSIYNPITKRIYLGNEVGNLWHNPTFLTMSLFGFVSVYLFIEYFINKKRETKILVLLAVSMFLSLTAKPNFIIVFIPTCGLYLLFELFTMKNDKRFQDILRGILVCVPCLIYLAFIFAMNFGGNSSTKIIISLFEVWLSFCKQSKLGVVAAFFCGNCIGLTHYFLNKKWTDKKSNYLLLLMLIGCLYFAVFAESGDTFNDGNFAWCYVISGLIFNSYAICDLLITSVNNGLMKMSAKTKIEYLVYFVHILSGVYYLYRLLGHYIKV